MRRPLPFPFESQRRKPGFQERFCAQALQRPAILEFDFVDGPADGGMERKDAFEISDRQGSPPLDGPGAAHRTGRVRTQHRVIGAMAPSGSLTTTCCLPGVGPEGIGAVPTEMAGHAAATAEGWSLAGGLLAHGSGNPVPSACRLVAIELDQPRFLYA